MKVAIPKERMKRRMMMELSFQMGLMMEVLSVAMRTISTRKKSLSKRLLKESF